MLNATAIHTPMQTFSDAGSVVLLAHGSDTLTCRLYSFSIIPSFRYTQSDDKGSNCLVTAVGQQPCSRSVNQPTHQVATCSADQGVCGCSLPLFTKKNNTFCKLPNISAKVKAVVQQQASSSSIACIKCTVKLEAQRGTTTWINST